MLPPEALLNVWIIDVPLPAEAPVTEPVFVPKVQAKDVEAGPPKAKLVDVPLQIVAAEADVISVVAEEVEISGLDKQQGIE